MSRTSRIGIVLVIFAALSWGGWALWFGTRTWCPVSVPVSLSRGSHTETKEFQLNLSGEYEIAIEANTTSSVGRNALACSLGVGAVWPQRACSTASSLSFAWKLENGRTVAAKGSSDEVKGGSTTVDSASRIIGYFRPERGQRYKLVVDTVSDFNGATGANPRLTVSVGGTIYEFCLVMDGLIRWGSGGIAVIGIILFLVSTITKARSVTVGNPLTTKS